MKDSPLTFTGIVYDRGFWGTRSLLCDAMFDFLELEIFLDNYFSNIQLLFKKIINATEETIYITPFFFLNGICTIKVFFS